MSRKSVELLLLENIESLGIVGDVVKVTPSSKCVGDLALYLVTRRMTAADVLDGSKTLDYPDSVVGLMEGRLGFPHRGFPADVQSLVETRVRESAVDGDLLCDSREQVLTPLPAAMVLREEVAVRLRRASFGVLRPLVAPAFAGCALRTVWRIYPP